MGHKGRHLFRNGACQRQDCGKPQGETDYAARQLGQKRGPYAKTRARALLAVAAVPAPAAPLTPPRPPRPCCPRCGGFLHADPDLFGRKEQDGMCCVNCGYAGRPRPDVVGEDPDAVYEGKQRRRRATSHGVRL